MTVSADSVDTELYVDILLSKQVAKGTDEAPTTSRKKVSASVYLT
jgi:hypothetical protein